MRILFFYASKGNLFDKLYALIHCSRLSRVEIEFSDGYRFGISIYTGQLTFNTAYFRQCEWISYTLPEHEKALRHWCEKHRNVHIGRLAKWLICMRPLFIRAFGVKKIAEALSHAGYNGVPTNRVTPDMLERWVAKWLDDYSPLYYNCKQHLRRPKETLTWE